MALSIQNVPGEMMTSVQTGHKPASSTHYAAAHNRGRTAGRVAHV